MAGLPKARRTIRALRSEARGGSPRRNARKLLRATCGASGWAAMAKSSFQPRDRILSTATPARIHKDAGIHIQ